MNGSGTESDPYDASPRSAPPISVSLSYSGREATATATGHGYADGDVITIAGVTGAGTAQFNGTFPIYSKTTDTFKYYMNAVPRGASAGSPTSARVIFPFDELMKNFPANTAIRLGPGVFETRGQLYWKPKSGQKITGSGIDVTTLKIVYAAAKNLLHLAVGVPFNEYITDFELSDFTVDCDLPGQPVTPPDGTTTYERARVACGAISVGGQRIRIRRIRAINFGTQGINLPPPDPANPECFVIFTASAYIDGNPNPYDCVVEDCIIEKPSENNTRETTCINMGAGEPLYSGYMSYHRACVIRNCYVNCEYANGVSSHWIPVDSLTRDPTNHLRAILITRSPHNRTANDIVAVLGAHEGTSPDLSPLFNGAFEIESVDPANNKLTYIMGSDPGSDATGDIFIGVTFQAYSADGGTAAVIENNYARQVRAAVFHDTYSTKDVIVRNNYFTDVFAGVQHNMGNANTPKFGQSLTRSGAIATFTTVNDHALAAGDAVIIAGADQLQYNSPPDGAFAIKSAGPDPKVFTYDLLDPDNLPATPATGPFTFRTLWQVRRLVVENNVMELAAAVDNYGTPEGVYLDGGVYNGPYVFRQVVIRGNVMRHIEGVSDPSGYRYSQGVVFVGCENIIIEDNVIDLDNPYQLQWRNCKNVRLFNNQTPSGKLLDALNDVTFQYLSDGARVVEDALTLGF